MISFVFDTFSKYPGYPLVEVEVEEVKISILLRDYNLSPRKLVIYEKDEESANFSSFIFPMEVRGRTHNMSIYYCHKDELVLIALGRFLYFELNSAGVFHPNSFAFRNDRKIVDLHFQMQSWCGGSRQLSSILVFNLYHSLSKVSHPILLKKLKTCLKDRFLLDLIKSFLSLKIMMKTGKFWSPNEGLLPFPCLTPVLFNYYLDDLDHVFSARFPECEYARYYDYVFIPIFSGQSKETELREFFNERGFIFCLANAEAGGDAVECPGGLLFLSKEGSLFFVNTGDS